MKQTRAELRAKAGLPPVTPCPACGRTVEVHDGRLQDHANLGMVACGGSGRAVAK